MCTNAKTRGGGGCYASGPEWNGEKREHVSTNPFVVAQAKGTIIRQALM